jgi:hypothetical protein
MEHIYTYVLFWKHEMLEFGLSRWCLFLLLTLCTVVEDFWVVR